MKGLTIGRVVWTWSEEVGAYLPAIVTKVVDKEAGKVELQIFTGSGNSVVGVRIDMTTGLPVPFEFGEEKVQGKWKWPERAE